MPYKLKPLFYLFAHGCLSLSLLIGCGSSNNPSDEPSIEAPKLTDATSKGLVFAALNHDPSAGNSIVYFYNFKEGLITKLSQGESADPMLLALGSKVILFNRHNNLKNYKILDPLAPDSNPKGINLNLADGDPLDGVAIDTKEDLMLLASPAGQKLQTLRISSGTVNTISSTSNLSVPAIRPLNLNRVDQTVYVTHSGLAVSSDGIGKSDQSQQVFISSISGEGLTFTDLDPSTPKIDGSLLTASFPLFLSKKGVLDFKIVGLCNPQMQGCQAGIDRVQNNKAQRVSLYTKQDQARYVDQFIPTADQSSGYGLVANTQDETILGRVSLSDGTLDSTLKTFGQKRLYGLAYESGSQTLIVGDMDGDRDALNLFRDNKIFKKIEIDGVFYRGVLID